MLELEHDRGTLRSGLCHPLVAPPVVGRVTVGHSRGLEGDLGGEHCLSAEDQEKEFRP